MGNASEHTRFHDVQWFFLSSWMLQKNQLFVIYFSDYTYPYGSKTKIGFYECMSSMPPRPHSTHLRFLCQSAISERLRVNVRVNADLGDCDINLL
ncbi:unnamed protein product [Cylicocyclus nassatus]|uniref:Uncharacterized protein n=1 Tax=Cylicocyclus nassatus TaxID=53992 RepID=A0AA36GFD2_CYLNA|nr:unnamed protein product [Cylicocyclus nassatus]